jgi:hypothetical protein
VTVRLARAERPLTERWSGLPVEPRAGTRLGISFRPRQVEALGLDARATLGRLLAYPFEVIRLGAYWDRMEPRPGAFQPEELDWQVAEAEAAGKQVIVCVGAVKTFGYPEFFVPAHHLPTPLPEGALITTETHASLLAAATAFVIRVVERYLERASVVTWQVEHEAVDPLGMEHSWRLATGFVAEEVAAVRKADPTRPILMNGFLPTSLPVRVQQWWRTRDQGDSLAVARELADIVGIDYYPRHALIGVGGRTLYLDGARSSGNQSRRKQVFAWARTQSRRLMISEGQAEPWEAVTTPPSPQGEWMFSCPPEQLIGTYNECMRWAQEAGITLEAYLFWGAEYWLQRAQSANDKTYLKAFARILENA